jgi:hypothetical protein
MILIVAQNAALFPPYHPAGLDALLLRKVADHVAA